MSTKSEYKMLLLKPLVSEANINQFTGRFKTAQKDLEKVIKQTIKDLYKRHEDTKATQLQELYKKYGIELFIKINQLLGE